MTPTLLPIVIIPKFSNVDAEVKAQGHITGKL
jgi:hypothetical protein